MRNKVPKKIEIGFQRHFCKEHIQVSAPTLSEIVDYLRQNNLRITKSRLTILEILLDGHHFHTVTSIIRHARKMNVKTNVSSVYNNLYALTRAGVIKTNVDMVAGATTYELALDTVPHIHIFDSAEEKQYALEIDCEVHKTLVDSFYKKGLILTDYLIQATVRKRNDDKE